MKRFSHFFILVFLSFLLLATVVSVQAAVTLISFTAQHDGVSQKISLLWETGSELDFSGFFIRRSLSSDAGSFERLKDENNQEIFFPAQGEGGAGAQYAYDDTHVEIDITYYYRLEMIDLGGESSYSDIVSDTLGTTPTPTFTPTPTPTPTVTQAGAPGSITPSVTKTTTPTRTKTHQPTFTITRTPSPYHVVTFTSPPQPSFTPTETPTITPTSSDTPTATTTLIPLPSITLLFPVRTHTPTFTPSPTDSPSPIPPTSTPTPKPSSEIPLRMSFLAGIIVLLWITLAGFLFAYFRKMSNS